MNRSIGDGFTKWEWIFEGAETTTSTDEHPRAIIYKTPGAHSVTLTATNANGSNTQTITSAIIVKTVNAKFTASATTVNVGTQITFTNQTTGEPTSWNWSFPGGTPKNSTEQNPVITYSTFGTYDVTLEVSDAEYNDTEMRTGYITVLDPADFDDDLLYNVKSEFEDQLSQNIFTGDNSGYVTGQTSLKIDQYAEKFEITNPNLNAVKQIRIKPSVLQSNSNDPHIIIKIWNGTNKPTDEVYSKDVPFEGLVAGKFNNIELASPVIVDKDFFVGYEVLYEIPVDTFAVVHLTLQVDGEWANTAYMNYNSAWSPFSDIFAKNSSLAIKALVCFSDITTGIRDELSSNEEEKLKIYPNPLVYKSNVVFPNKTNQKYRLVVVDASGRVVRIIENITGNNVIINREQLKPGIHIINIQGEKIYKGKLLVK